ncbi:2-oxoacid:acceptor oxidoreductase family protein [bacterium]|nr:2-oxoacid:acceptor oxidoreductase family protein [bacterium]
MIEIRWHGRGGQGSWTAARLLGKAAALFEDKYALSFPSFGPERRGAPVLGFTKIDSEKILDRSEVKFCDYVVILDETLVGADTLIGLKEDSVILLNTANPERHCGIFDGLNLITIDATSLALEYLGRPITNTVMLAALAAASDIVKLSSIMAAMKSELKPAILEKNILVANAAYKIVMEGVYEQA